MQNTQSGGTKSFGLIYFLVQHVFSGSVTTAKIIPTHPSDRAYEHIYATYQRRHKLKLFKMLP